MTNAYFEKLEKLYYIEGLKKLDIINLSALIYKGTVSKNKKKFCHKSYVFFVRPRTFRTILVYCWFSQDINYISQSIILKISFLNFFRFSSVNNK